jgi:8-hydroxy-5-deazaflavin:NADPH oxidoreductase
MRLGILGTGHVATTLAGAWSTKHEIALGSRDPVGKDAGHPVLPLADAIAGADVVVNAILGAVAVDVISGIRGGVFGGKTLIDVANATTSSSDLVYPNLSLAEKLQEARPDASVVNTLNCAAITFGANPAQIGPTSVFLSGNSYYAKAQTTGLLKTEAFNIRVVH